MRSHNIMFKIKMLSIAVAITLAFVPTGINADEGKASFSGHFKIEKYHKEYDVRADGTYTAIHDTLIHVLTEEGVKSANQAGFVYSESLDETEILSAYTLKKDGRRVEAPAANIQEREAVSGGGPMFSDLKARVIVFPELSSGDKVGYSYKLVRKQALFPGHFSLAEAFTKFVAYDDVRVSVRAPVGSLDLQVFASGVEGGRLEDGEARAQWVWTLKNQEITIPEIGSVDAIDYGPRIIVSSFKNYGAIAAAYDERSRPKGLPTDKIRALAAELTAEVTEQREQARLLYTWVIQNIRFAGNFMGVGSVVPYHAEEVLANRLGDCKDHTVLFQALLAAKNIDSTAVLVNLGGAYTLPEVAAPSVLNHVIVYIPGLDIYADPSAEYVPFGSLPITVAGKPVIHTSGFTGIRQTPAIRHDANTSTMKMVIRINEDGSAEGETNNEETGSVAALARQGMARVQPNLEDMLIRQILQQRGLTGTGKLTKADPRELTEPYTYGFRYHVNNAINLPGPGAIYISPVFSSARPISGVLSGLNMPERTLNFACMGDILTEEYMLHFPKNVKIISLPKDVHVENGTIRYDSTYRQEGNTVTVARKYDDRTLGPVCTPKEDNEFRSIALDILKDLKAQLVYQKLDDVQ